MDTEFDPGGLSGTVQAGEGEIAGLRLFRVEGHEKRGEGECGGGSEDEGRCGGQIRVAPAGEAKAGGGRGGEREREVEEEGAAPGKGGKERAVSATSPGRRWGREGESRSTVEIEAVDKVLAEEIGTKAGKLP